jgi:hypothetical protein
MNISRQCRVTRQDIDESPAGRLGAGTIRHLSDCEGCRTFQHERASLRELVGSLEPVTAPADFDIRLRARLAAQPAVRTGWFGMPSFAFGTPALAAAAAVVVIIGGFALFSRSIVTRETAKGDDVPTVQSPVIVPPSPVVSDGGVKGTILGERELATEPLPPINRSRPDRSQNPRPAMASAPRSKSSDFAALGANSIKQGETPGIGEIQLGRPFQFSLQDKRGVTRQITLPPLSFGSPQLVQGNRYQPASYSSNRIW